MPDPRRNERGYRVGEGHHRARLTDAQVHEIRELHEVRGLRYEELVRVFTETHGVPVSYHVVRKVCQYVTRVQAGEMHP